MMYPYLTLDDGTEIVHSHYLDNETVKVYVETPDEKDGFHHMTCYLPSYHTEDIVGYSQEAVDKYMKMIRASAHLIIQFSKEGGFDNASSF